MRKLGFFVFALCAVVTAALLVCLEVYRFKKIEKKGPTELSRVAATIPVGATALSVTILNTFNVWKDLARTSFSGTYKNRFPTDSKWSHLYLFQKGDPR